MLTELLMQDERRAGRIEEQKASILEFLKELGDVSDDVQQRIIQENQLEQLRIWVKLAAKANSLEQFVQNM